MSFKINISDKGKTYKLEVESENLIGKEIGDNVSGNDVDGKLSGYELEIKGTSDKSGFAGNKDVEGAGLRRILLKKGKFLRKTPHKGFRRKKTVRGNQISSVTVQINMVVVKKGSKELEEIFSKKEEGGEGGGENVEGKKE